MSYSIAYTEPTKEAAKVRFVLEFDAIVVQQPAHSVDRDAAIANAHAAIDLLVADQTHDVRVNAHGSLTWLEPGQITGACVSVNAWNVPKGAA